MEPQSVLVETKERISTLVLNRPRKKNSLSPEMVEQLLTTLKQLSIDKAIRVLVIRGWGEHAFCTGYDIGSLPAQTDEDAEAHLKRLGRVEILLKAVAHFPWPVIVMLNGVAFGAGLELALCGDIRIGTVDIRCGMPPAKLGIVYPWRGLKRFIQIIGPSATKEMFFSGSALEGPRLKEVGLLDHLVSRHRLETFTRQLAEAIADNAPLALKGTKKIINLVADSLDLKNEDLIVAETLTQKAFLSEDAKEGRLAFLEKRPPRFKGR